MRKSYAVFCLQNKTRDARAGPGGAVGDVVRRSLPIDGGVERQDQLGLRPEPGDQANNVEFVRADAVERRQGAAQHMIAPAERAGALQGREIGEVLGAADWLRVARGIAT